MKIKSYLKKIEKEIIATDSMIFPDCEISPEKIRIMMIDEAPPFNPNDDFFSESPKASYPKTTLSLFNLAGVDVKSIYEILNMGIYITTAVKIPRNKKVDKIVSNEMIQEHLPILEAELALFPNLKAIILMGGTAIKAINYIAKKQTGKNLIPLGYIYKIHDDIHEWNGKRVFPSCMMTGKTILREKAQCDMIIKDIKRMMPFLKEQ